MSMHIEENKIIFLLFMSANFGLFALVYNCCKCLKKCREKITVLPTQPIAQQDGHPEQNGNYQPM